MTATRLSWRDSPAVQGASRQLRGRLKWLESPLATYYLILGSAGMLVGLGLVMVLSASSVTSYMDTQSPYSDFTKQAVFAVVGVIVATVTSRLPIRVFKVMAFPLMLAALFLQVLVMVPGIGVEVLGNRNWIRVGGLQIQPSEIGKVALILMVALVLSNRQAYLHDPRRSILPTVPYVVLLIGLIMLGKDLGTTMVVAVIYLGMLWCAGARKALFGWLAALALVTLPIAVWTSGNRTSRIQAWLGGCDNVDLDGCYQKVHGMYALAGGGVWGLGPGASREKWQWLPEAHNDFIFAIIGEELGLPGALTVLALYVVLAYACYRLIAQTRDMFVRVASAGIMVWICFQAMVNIGSVLGIFPIVGVPLPLVSYGGSALVMTLFGIGILLAFARQEPGAAEALTLKPRRVARTLAVLPRRKG
ncbi:cell division protein FtsW [Dermacoccus nishinomiyaensis]|uniref:Probable peptidoglycan glycosyltransferase FtsW n=1 Tax=Dermacoccus nishinomiyaensis TaxID=1274 RepID=A0A075JGY1_9MICO|nr:putative lipid II flippase FtsW [Dermacoccus nishinomiyaensis]AIF40552.1 cell division protein FtsW [Dermacoccus nishinomiyaensis]